MEDGRRGRVGQLVQVEVKQEQEPARIPLQQMAEPTVQGPHQKHKHVRLVELVRIYKINMALTLVEVTQ